MTVHAAGGLLDLAAEPEAVQSLYVVRDNPRAAVALTAAAFDADAGRAAGRATHHLIA